MSATFVSAKCPVLAPAQFDPAKLLEGTNPQARFAKVLQSLDFMATTFVWECSPGKFDLLYDRDETIYIIEGSVLIDEGRPTEQRIQAGDIAFFPAGTHVHWKVESYVRKVAFQRIALPKPFLKPLALLHKIKNWHPVWGRRPTPISEQPGLNTDVPVSLSRR